MREIRKTLEGLLDAAFDKTVSEMEININRGRYSNILEVANTIPKIYENFNSLYAKLSSNLETNMPNGDYEVVSIEPRVMYDVEFTLMSCKNNSTGETEKILYDRSLLNQDFEIGQKIGDVSDYETFTPFLKNPELKHTTAYAHKEFINDYKKEFNEDFPRMLF